MFILPEERFNPIYFKNSVVILVPVLVRTVSAYQKTS